MAFTVENASCLLCCCRPEIAKHTVNALPKPYSGAYLTTLCECTLLLLTMTIIQFSKLKYTDYTLASSSPTDSESVQLHKTGRSIITIARQRTFLIAALGGFVSWSAMAVQMSAAPLAMTAAGYTFSQATTTVECHLLGMFVPSFFTGTLCSWFGNRLVMLFGLLIQLTGALLFQRGFEIHHFNLGIVIIGVGWNFGYVGASALLTHSHRPEEKTKTHSLYEAIVMASISLSFFSSAFALQFFGWMFLTGKIVSTYLTLAVFILAVDTTLVFHKTRGIHKEIIADVKDTEPPE